MVRCPSSRFVIVRDRRRRRCTLGWRTAVPDFGFDDGFDDEQQAGRARRTPVALATVVVAAAVTAVAAQQSVSFFVLVSELVVDGQQFGVRDVGQIGRRRIVGQRRLRRKHRADVGFLVASLEFAARRDRHLFIELLDDLIKIIATINIIIGPTTTIRDAIRPEFWFLKIISKEEVVVRQ